MKKLTVSEIRHAVNYVLQDSAKIEMLEKMTDDDFLKIDFCKDLQMGNIRIHNVMIELERFYNLCLPIEFYKLVADDTVNALMEAINYLLAQKESRV